MRSRRSDDGRDILKELEVDSEKLVRSFGASRVSDLKRTPDLYTFRNGLMYSHRDFDKFYERLLKGEKSAIVSGLNPSATLHIGHMPVFDTNLHFQKKHSAHVFIPLSDDESYVTLKIKDQEEGLRNALTLTRSLLAYGYDPKRTHFIIDQINTDIYNAAIKLSRGITMSEIKAVYGYENDQNTGLHFYPAVQSAHIIYPELTGARNVLVPIGADEDSHLRVCRDVAEKFGYDKPAVLHTRFLPGVDGFKMSKSKNNAVFLLDEAASVKKKIFSSFSGGRPTVDEHRRLGGVPEADVSFIYLKGYFLAPDEAEALYKAYKKGEILSGDMKKMFHEKVQKRLDDFRRRYDRITPKDIDRVVMKNESVDLMAVMEKFGLFEA